MTNATEQWGGAHFGLYILYKKSKDGGEGSHRWSNVGHNRLASTVDPMNGRHHLARSFHVIY